MSTMKRRVVVGSLVVLALVCVAVLLQVSGRPAKAADEAAALDTFLCTPVGVASFSNRVHVRCSSLAPGNIRYFAVCSSDAVGASRFLSVFTTGFVMGKGITVYYTASDTSGTACGCNASDCRVIWGAEVQ